MKKSNSVIAAVIIIIILVAGGFAIFHKSPKTTPTNNAAKSSVAAVTSAILTTKTNASIGQYLVGSSGETLYTYGEDTKGVSNCTGSCLAAWPAYIDAGSTTNLPSGVGTIKRTDNGEIQYTYNGLPLYYFASESKGQITGNGVNNFNVAVPAAASSAPASSTSNPNNY